jgi:hypothetical protein
MAVSLSAETLLDSLTALSQHLPPATTKIRRRLYWETLETMRFVQRAATPQLYAMRMREARAYSGLTLSEISDRTTYEPIAKAIRKPRIPVSSLSDLCNPKRKRLPRPETVRGFLMAIDAPESVVQLWLKMLPLVGTFPQLGTSLGVEEWVEFAGSHGRPAVVQAGQAPQANAAGVTLGDALTSP